MAARGFLSKILSTFGSYRFTLASRASAINYQQTAGVRKDATKKLETMNMPERPKKPLLPFFRYMLDRRVELVKQNPKIKIVEISTKCAEEWRDFDENSKKKYQEKYQKDLTEYAKKHLEYVSKLTEEQKELLTIARKEKSESKKLSRMRKANKETGKPKGVRNAFIYYLQDRMKAEGQPLRAIIKTAPEVWRALSEAEKRKYNELAEDDKKRYEIEMTAWEERMVKDGNLALVRQTSLTEKKPQLTVKGTKKIVK